MKKLKVLLLAAVMSFTMIGCGGGGGNNNVVVPPPSAETLLLGKTFYSTDNELDDPDGYYQLYFDTSFVIESEYAGDGTLLWTYDPEPITYSGTTIISLIDGEEFALEVIEAQKSVDFVFNGVVVSSLWYTIEDAKANPQDWGASSTE